MFFNRVAALASLAMHGASMGIEKMGEHLSLMEHNARIRHRDSWFGRGKRSYSGHGSIADKPHKHLREIARRTTRPGTEARRNAYAAARRGDEAAVRAAS